MNVAEQVLRLKTDFDDVYEAGKVAGRAEGAGVSPLYYIASLAYTYGSVEFPEDYDFVVETKKTLSLNSTFMNAKNVRSITLKCSEKDDDITTSVQNAFRNIPQLLTIDLTDYGRKVTSLSWMILDSKNVKKILGELDLSECTAAENWGANTNSLEEVYFKEGTINIPINFHWWHNLIDAAVDSIIDGLADLTGQEKKKVTFHSTVLSNMSIEQYQKIKNKNWTTE